MFIEDEAEAVFNEIRNQRQDNDDKGEWSTSNDVMMTAAATETKAVSPAPAPAPAPLMTIKVAALSRAEQLRDKTATEGGGDEIGEADIELEEPVSPPACHPSEGPPLLFSQSIEDLAAVIVKEKRQEEEKEEKEEEEVPKFVDKKCTATTACKAVPALIPLTVSEFGERPPVNSPSTLHMSGGGVYTTDSYYRKPPTTSTTTTASTSGGRPAPAPPQLSVIKKLPVSPPPAWMPAKKRTVIKSKTASAEDIEKTENVLRQFYKNSNLISEAQKTIKLSDGLEITPIINVPTVAPSELAKKRSSESTDNDHNQGSKRARNDLVIEKVPRKNTEKERTEQSNLQTNEQALNCKLVISRVDKKAKIVFENGIEVPISKNIFKHIIQPSKPTTSQSNRIRRKTARTRKISNAKLESNLEKEAKVTKDDSGNPEPLADMPLIVDSGKVEFPESCRATKSNSKLAAPAVVVGQHKLPCVVSQPSYQRWANRKTLLAKSK